MPARSIAMPLISNLPVPSRPWHLRRWLGPGFTAGEVRRLLRYPCDDARGHAVRRCVTRSADWLPSEPHFITCPLRYHAQLPRIVFWYMCGEALPDIARRAGEGPALGRLPPIGLERALDTACRRIAARLNAVPHEYGLR
jgi:hypothetical protein